MPNLELPRPAALQFHLEDLEAPRRPSLLLASVSESVYRARGSPASWAPGLMLPQPLRRAISKLPKHRSSQQPRPASPDLGKAGAELQRSLAVLAGVLITGVAQAARQLALHRHARRAGELRDSFRMPWQFDRRAGSRGASREAHSLARVLTARGLEYERNMDVRAAVQCFEEINRLVPGQADYLSMLAKQWSDLTFYYDVNTDKERQLVNLKALEYADKAVTEHPDNVLCHVAQCVSKGRLALFTDNKTKVRLAKEAQEAARTAIVVDPQSDIAHHLMGRWHYEMAQINPLLRALVRIMYGTALSPGTHSDALASYRRAMELNPRRLIHRVEAGKVLLHLGRKEEAAAEFEAALHMETEDINAWHTRHDAERLLAQIQRRPYKQPSLVPPHVHQQLQQHAAEGGADAPLPASLSTAALLEQSQAAAA